MKKIKVERTLPKKPTKMGWETTVQYIDEIIVLNVYCNKILKARHCINSTTKEYATLKGAIWSASKIENIYEIGNWYSYRFEERLKERAKIDKEDEEKIRELIQLDTPYYTTRDIVEYISRAEFEYGRDKRGMQEQRRQQKIKDMMDRVPEIPAGIKKWIDQKEINCENYALKDRKTKLWSCTSCGNEFEQERLKRIGGGKWRNNDIVECPECHEAIKIKTRKQFIEIKTHFGMIQPIDDTVSVARHFTATIECTPGKRKALGLEEDVRIMLFKGVDRKRDCDIYYEQYRRPAWVEEGECHNGCFDNKKNPSNKTEFLEYMYDGGIEEAFKDTGYEEWTRLFTEFARTGLKLQYNAMMCSDSDNYRMLVEMLFRGRFYKLLQEESCKISYWNLAYCGGMYLSGSSVEEVFGLNDKQKINRIREKNGGNLMLDWMKWSERRKQKISDKALNWLIQNGIEYHDMAWTNCRFSIEQAMNFIERQRKESYKGRTIKGVISQYEDYMSMCERLHKDTSDEMVYRPRELKRRHDEAVAEIERQRAQLKAEEYSKKFGEAEKVLGDIKEKYEYVGDNFFIKVPERIVDIVAEGNYLHHCAGATDRYFDRIKSHETYICFLRKTEEPDTPFYTIEVEPGGTIRQHRGMFDEEPELEKVKPFLRDWQKEVRKRMSKADHELAAVSKIKREQNIEELKAKNNTRVLNGLMEDFMEAI